MIGNMGTLTLCILLIHEKRYTEKITDNLLTHLNNLPMKDAIVACLKAASSPANVANLLRALGDYLILVSDRTISRI